MTQCTDSKDYTRPADRYLLPIKAAASYFSLGENKIRQVLRDNPDAHLSLTCGNRVLVKRIAFEKFLEGCECI